MALLLFDSCRRKIFRIGSGAEHASVHQHPGLGVTASTSTAGQIMTTKTFQDLTSCPTHGRNKALARSAAKSACFCETQVSYPGMGAVLVR